MELKVAQVESKTLSSTSPEEFLDILDARIVSLMYDIEASEVWKVLTSPSTSPDLVREIMKEIYLEITSYQPHVIEAAIAIIGQMPRSMAPKMVTHMLKHQAEEFDHGEMAMRDYIGLGGDEHYARNQHQISPASFAVSAVWWMIAHVRDPFAYIGALYPFEGLTPIVTERVKPFLKTKGIPDSALEFIEFHSTEDPKHTKLVRYLIKQIIVAYPESKKSILHGLECFLDVYPLPVWNTAYRRAQHKVLTLAPA